MANDSFPVDPVPGYTKPTHEYGRTFGDEFHAPAVDELLASYARFTQRGVTLAGGQGVLLAGYVLARKTSDKKYYIYKNTASDGTQIPLGVLREERDTGGGNSTVKATGEDCLGNLVTSGILNLAMLSGTDTTALISTGSGGDPVVTGPMGIGSAAGGVVTLLNARVDTAVSQFIF